MIGLFCAIMIRFKKIKMKNKNILFSLTTKKLPLRIFVCFVSAFFFVFGVSPFVGNNSIFHGVLAEAEGFEVSSLEGEQTYPYIKTFTISAYYSPIPCQNRYATGTYAGDIRLNGRGVAGADGTPVYPGMIAAPKSYPFGTKMDIPGVGIVAVHDRGGAIVASDTDGVFDRLDIWMGYGDKGLARALNWGKRTVNVVVYGKNDAIKEQIVLDGYSISESVPNDCDMSIVAPVSPPKNEAVSVVAEPLELINSSRLISDLKFGDSGAEVIRLQKELKNLNFFKTSITGYYGEITEHAVFKFQQSQRLVGNKNSLGAGIFGPKTRDSLNRIVIARDYNTRLVAEATGNYQTGNLIASDISAPVAKEIVLQLDASKDRVITKELNPGQTDKDVSALQIFLREKGFFEGMITTNYFGPVTKEALIRFQIANGIITSKEDLGAGRVGPQTLSFINNQ